MDVVLIGAGNVGTVLGRTLKQANHTIKAIWNRHPEKARLLADELGTVAVDHMNTFQIQHHSFEKQWFYAR